MTTGERLSPDGFDPVRVRQLVAMRPLLPWWRRKQAQVRPYRQAPAPSGVRAVERHVAPEPTCCSLPVEPLLRYAEPDVRGRSGRTTPLGSDTGSPSPTGSAPVTK